MRATPYSLLFILSLAPGTGAMFSSNPVSLRSGTGLPAFPAADAGQEGNDAFPRLAEVEESDTVSRPPVFIAGKNKVKVYRDTNKDHTVLHFRSDMAVEGDGAPTAYHPDRSVNGGGLEGWSNGGIVDVIEEKGNYFVHGKGADGKPYAIVIHEADTLIRHQKVYYRAYVQGADDPAPGYFYSTTALVQGGKEETEAGRFVDASGMPFISLADWQKFSDQGARKGDFGTVYCPTTGKLVHVVVGDVGGAHLGEGSLFLAKAILGVEEAPTYTDRAGHTRLSTVQETIIYLLYPNSGSTSSIPSGLEIETAGRRLYEEWGGMERLEMLYPKN